MLREVRLQVICRSTIRPFQNLFRPHRGRFVDNRSNLDTGLVVGSIYMQVSLIRVHLSSLTCRTHPRPKYSEMMGTNWKFCSCLEYLCQFYSRRGRLCNWIVFRTFDRYLSTLAGWCIQTCKNLNHIRQAACSTEDCQRIPKDLCKTPQATYSTTKSYATAFTNRRTVNSGQLRWVAFIFYFYL